MKNFQFGLTKLLFKVVNVIIAAGWKLGQSKSLEKVIYNVSTSGKNPVTWREFVDNLIETAFKYPYGKVVLQIY
jgi:hypothetical protein